MYVHYTPYSSFAYVSGVWTNLSGITTEPIRDGGSIDTKTRWIYNQSNAGDIASLSFVSWHVLSPGFVSGVSSITSYNFPMADNVTPRGWSVTIDDASLPLGTVAALASGFAHIDIETPAGFGAGYYRVVAQYSAQNAAGGYLGTIDIAYDLLIQFDMSAVYDTALNAVVVSLTPNTQALDLNGLDPSPTFDVTDVLDTHWWWGALIGVWPATGYTPGTTPRLAYIKPQFRLTSGSAADDTWFGSTWAQTATPDTYSVVIDLDPGDYVLAPSYPAPLPDSRRPGKYSAFAPRYIGTAAVEVTVPGPAPIDGGGTGGTDPGFYTLRSDHRLAVPQLAVDDTTGRLMIAVGMTDFQLFYYCGPKPDGGYHVHQNGATKFVPRPIYFAAATGAGDDPLFTGAGKDIGIVPDTSTGWEVLFPDGVQALTGQGEVRVGILHYQQPTSATIIPGPAWRVSTDGGNTWTDSPETTSQADTPYWQSHAGETLPGSRRQRRAMQGSGLPVVRSEGYNGASGWTNSRGDLMFVNRFPIYEHRGPTGPFANRWGPWAKDPGDYYRTPYGDNPGRQECRAVITHDGNKTRVTQPAPAVGSVDASITNVPGYPFAGEWCGQFTEGRFAFGAAGLGSGTPPAHPSGGLAWADGAANGTAYLFCVAIMRMPIPRDSFPVDTQIDGILKEYTDAEDHTLNEGIDCGHTTCIVYTWTADQGKTFGDLRVVKTDAGVILAAAETARIAAVTLPGGRLVLAVSDNGTVTIYTSEDGLMWRANCKSVDGGATWNKP
jgi:hypothetical protein